MSWPGLHLKKFWPSSLNFLSCFCVCQHKKRNEWKMQTGTYFAPSFKIREANQCAALSLFGMRCIFCMDSEQAFVASLASCQEEDAVCLFFFQPECFPRCQADRQQKPACLKHEIVASARTPKSPWRFWKRVRGKCTGSRKWLSQGHQWPIALDSCDMPGHFLRLQ